MENKRKLTMEELYEAVKALSHSQGFYGRFLEEMEEHWDELMPMLDCKFTDIVDFILFLES